LAHPLNLLSDGGERVDAVALRVEGEMNRDDVRLVEAGTREAAQGGEAKDVATFVAIQFMDQHRCEGKCCGKYTRPACPRHFARGPRGVFRGAGKYSVRR